MSSDTTFSWTLVRTAVVVLTILVGTGSLRQEVVESGWG
jgi:hypothetical protein